MPVFHLVQVLSFSLLGMSLASARTTTVGIMLLLCVIAYFLTKKAFGDVIAYEQQITWDDLDADF